MAEGGSTSSSNSGRANDPPEIPLPEIPLPCTIWIDIDRESGAEGSTPRIPKVPSTMKSNENLTKAVPKWSEPSMISIGPYHFNGCHEVQKLKTKHAEDFIRDSKQKRDDLYRMIDERTPELEKWYEGSIIGEDLKAIFLVDGCFLLNFINYSKKEDGFKLGLTNSEIVNIKRDLFLLENQLPYAVLELLLLHADTDYKNQMEEKIRDFVASHASFRDPRENCNAPNNSPETQSSNPPREREDEREMQTRVQGEQQKENRNPLNHRHLLHYLDILLDQRKSSNPEQAIQQEEQRGRTTHRRSCRTVQELRKVGVRFKPSATGSFTDISFKPSDCGTAGCLQLPTITLNTFTMTTFLNLIAFESSNSSGAIGLGVISYLCFMDSLIDSEDDVKELQAAGILYNSIGGTKEVAHFFNTVCSNVMPHPSYRNVIQKIENHVNRKGYKSRWRRWYVELKQQYFSSPWSCIALFAAILALLFAAIQAFTSLYSFCSRQSGK